MPKSIGFWRTTYVTWTQSFVSVYLAVSEKTGGQTDKQTNKQTNKQTERMTDKPTKQKDYTSPALAGAGDYNNDVEWNAFL